MKNLLFCTLVAFLLGSILTETPAQDTEKPISDYEKAVSLLTAGLNRLATGESWTYVVTEPGSDPLTFDATVSEISKKLIVLEEKSADGSKFETLWVFAMFKDELPAFGTYTFASGKEIAITIGKTKDGKLEKEDRTIKCTYIKVENMGMILEYWVPEELPLPYVRKVKTVEGQQSSEAITQLVPASN